LYAAVTVGDGQQLAFVDPPTAPATATESIAHRGPAPLAASGPARYPRRAMSVTSQQVRHIAKLARIGMDDAQIEALVPELNNILGWVEQLAEVNTDGVEPLTAVIDQKLRLRDDVVNDGDIRDKVLANAPEAQHGFFAVPKVIE
jgi:aspartyl-tRNA(Asn)/glutamyl-tRNA(Gln) amidotransferase subunit C